MDLAADGADRAVQTTGYRPQFEAIIKPDFYEYLFLSTQMGKLLSFITSVRLKIEQNQLVSGLWVSEIVLIQLQSA